jgi:hypothetical protein
MAHQTLKRWLQGTCLNGWAPGGSIPDARGPLRVYRAAAEGCAEGVARNAGAAWATGAPGGPGKPLRNSARSCATCGAVVVSIYTDSTQLSRRGSPRDSSEPTGSLGAEIGHDQHTYQQDDRAENKT